MSILSQTFRFSFQKKYRRWRLLLALWCVMGLLCYMSVWIPPRDFWPASLVSYAIPGVWLVNFLLALTLLFVRLKFVLYPVAMMMIGTPFIQETFAYNSPLPSTTEELSILSYNVKQFRKPHGYDSFSTALIQSVVADATEVKCFQEYSTNPKWEALDVTGQMEKQGYHGCTFAAKIRGNDHNPGMAIFSKSPILNSGQVWNSPRSKNGGLFVDIAPIKDTIRIYNVHLASMHIDLQQYKKTGHYGQKILYLLQALKNGAVNRSGQIDALVTHTQNCPYPFVIVGDFNDTPYSYNYHRLKHHYTNAFEAVGSGFGFSFNSLLFFLRIDHHFTGNGLKARSFAVDRSMRISDHFPTRAHYALPKHTD
ncbi:hypothetical protein BFP72_04870 [Reichenbachiella sp. 5M10]|uniref:endonuclease/exonuclease/phosphatase family protein n=1 Tax=Reichenbachiella sp. 5M10 TaxID=1889772 RepID=UPI000C14FFB3|nr:endonuclease/exonuclease/phosphatase family protein [Reichenbachiella sp. 5M10]PIB34783.1 hypothetical protein BFP72_04870 [Reichenbachiella sp. 5M10]